MISTEQFKTIVDSIGDPVFVLDQECKIVFLNSAACEMFQIPLENCAGQDGEYDFFSKEQADVFAAQNKTMSLQRGKRMLTKNRSLTDMAM
jgi:PAS domain S-box-containing protein